MKDLKQWSIERYCSIASNAYGDALAAFNMVHNTPLGVIVDTEDALQPRLYRAFIMRTEYGR